ncbi:hypothetical protein ACCO45_011194 [Purpureocillium lilacinum]|uniref:Uncharacterized protein n=1 Tax=Purpureocillium lilacinum TaxID=33203 RepID=A0ACC4DJK6_PURLI
MQAEDERQQQEARRQQPVRLGPREHLSMSDVPLPKPRDFKPKIAVDENHGLWGFFPAPGKALWTPKETEEHGRAWSVEELRRKSWEDLHALWWVCCKERNMLATSKVELSRGKLGFGEREIEMRDEEVQKTMRAIKHALTERYYTWQDAVDVARSDPEIDFESRDGQVYKPSAYEDDLEASESWAAEADSQAAAAETGKLQRRQPGRPDKCEGPGRGEPGQPPKMKSMSHLAQAEMTAISALGRNAPIAVASGGRWRALGEERALPGLAHLTISWLAGPPISSSRAAPAVAATGTVGVLPVATSRRGQRQVMLRASSPHLTDTMTGPKPRRFINPSSWAGPPKQLPINHKTGPKPHASHLLLVPTRFDTSPRNMDEIAKEYDVLVVGTGLTECILSGYATNDCADPDGPDPCPRLANTAFLPPVSCPSRARRFFTSTATTTMAALQKYGNYQKGEEPWKQYGRLNDWNIDLVPKFLMSSGELTNILVSTDVTRYLEFKQVAGSYVQQGSGPKATVAKVPSDAGEALKSPLMGIFEKRRMKSFIEWVGTFDLKDPATHKGLDMNTCSMKEVYDKFGLETGTRDFIGHAMAPEVIERVRLYGNSVARYGKSPYIYPLYGLGELPQGFARLSAIYGGTYMLNTTVDEFLYEGDKAVGIKATMSGVEEMKFETRAKMILGDPSYFPGKTKVVGHVLRAICILKHPLAGTNDSDSCQLIIPNIYIACVSSAHNVCPKGYWIAIVSTIAESSANHHLELQPGLDRLGKIEEQFMGPPIPISEPLQDGTKDNIFISKSYDATSHFETTTDDVKDIYRRCTGEELKVEGLRDGLTVADEQ